MLSIKLFQLVFSLFRFNRNIETLCFGIEPKQPKQTVSKQTEKTDKTETTLNFVKKIPRYALRRTVSVALLFVSVQSKHRNSLFRYWTEPNVLFRIVPKLVSVRVSAVSNRNWFRRTPYSESTTLKKKTVKIFVLIRRHPHHWTKVFIIWWSFRRIAIIRPLFYFLNVVVQGSDVQNGGTGQLLRTALAWT